MIRNFNQVHFWELRRRVRKEDLDLEKKLKEKLPEEVWVPLEKIEGEIFSLIGEKFHLKKVWRSFEEYKQKKNKEKDIFLFLGVKKRGPWIEARFFVGDDPGSFKANSRRFFRIPELASSFQLKEENGVVFPQFNFELF